MRDVGQFIGRYHAVDNGRAVGLERLVDGIAQLAGPFRLEAYPAACARQRHIIRIGEFNAVFLGRHHDRFGLKRDQYESRIVIHEGFHRQLMLDSTEKCAHQHLNRPSPRSAMTWRERSSAWMPLA